MSLGFKGLRLALFLWSWFEISLSVTGDDEVVYPFKHQKQSALYKESVRTAL
jgi:hypothetical protein